jgi:NAD(P)-dependent dehydrogenase (short-subunit alcohol dehydrogenase family)
MAAAPPGESEMSGRFLNRKVLVTGSTRGLGHAAALSFLIEGAEVVIHGRNEDRVMGLVAALNLEYPQRVRGYAADLGERAGQDRLAAFAGDLDILVNSAGVYEECKLTEASDDHWRKIIEVNLTAPWRLARALVPALARKSGVIVNVGSDSALLGYAGSSVYCASKGALVGLTRALATELAPKIRALCVCPGSIDTDMMHEAVASKPDPAAALQQWQTFSHLKRIATPGEIAEAILFAASPSCSYQTGSVIVVDGGTTAGRRL